MRWAASAFVMLCAGTMPAHAQDAAPSLSVSIRETLDLWDNAHGGIEAGAVLLNKLQVSATATGDDAGIPGFSAHVQIFRTDGGSLSRRVGDIQTVSNIEAVPTTRLFESWVEKKFGSGDRSFAIRAGLIDLNSDFDSIQTAGLFVNSSHGIGADLARSGRNGPSIYPVSALALRLSWLPSKRWTFRAAVFDGVPGDPDRPKALVAARLAPSDGTLLIGQVDYHLSDKAKIEVGTWTYTAKAPAFQAIPDAHDRGLYASIEGPVPGLKDTSAWVRAGVANGNAQSVDNYLGGGLVAQGLIGGRLDDRIGLAIARAGIGQPARTFLALPHAETTIELSYQYRVKKAFAVQPDLQFVENPAGISGARNAVVLGFRVILTAGYPRKAPATEPADPTVQPDTPASGGQDQ